MGNWFANRGQFIQTIFAAVALVFAGANAWNSLKGNEFFSGGAILFYALVILAFVSVLRATLLHRNSDQISASTAIITSNRHEQFKAIVNDVQKSGAGDSIEVVGTVLRDFFTEQPGSDPLRSKILAGC